MFTIGKFKHQTARGQRGVGQRGGVVTTNSDGSPARRAFLLSRLGPGSVETILDPGIDVVTQRLAGPETGPGVIGHG